MTYSEALALVDGQADSPAKAALRAVLVEHEPENDPEYDESAGRMLCPACSSYYGKAGGYVETVEPEHCSAVRSVQTSLAA